jgi:hypothetical protein
VIILIQSLVSQVFNLSSNTVSSRASFTHIILGIILLLSLHENSIFQLLGRIRKEDFKRILSREFLLNFQKVLLGMRSDLSSRSSPHMCFDFSPLLAKQSECFNESLMLLVCPSAHNFLLFLRLHSI